MELWRIADLLKNGKQLKVKQRTQLGCSWAFYGKKRHDAFWTNGSARDVRFLLEVTYGLVLAQKRQKVCLFLAAARYIFT